MIQRHRALYLTIALTVAVFAGWPAKPQTTDRRHSAGASPTPNLVNVCLITNNVPQLIEFYEPVLGLRAQRSSEDYAEFHTGVGVLAIFSSAAQEKYIPGSSQAAQNKGTILEFRIADVDQEYIRLQRLVKTWVKPPSTQPWGTRSIYFRDPDGNLVDFYSPPKPQ